ncbi:hypothetical protein [Pedobacter ureilyticus]|uniref:NERD domain-containing protein n=1 Tax=Pedobacter ureilyticus TaxID=1393051 RepID=A0ABW9J8B1_9SPHI|nr:hypothetical protein [Pedobacter helvus]
MLNIAVEETKLSGATHPFIVKFINTLPINYQQIVLPRISTFYLSTAPVITEILADLLTNDLPSEIQSVEFEGIFAVTAFNAVLVYNEHRYSELGLGIKKNSIELIWKMLLSQGINAEHPAAYPRTGIAKQLAFIGFLKDLLNEEFEDFEARLLKVTGFSSIYDYPLTFINLIVTKERAISENNLLIVVPKDHVYYDIFHQIDVVTWLQTSNNNRVYLEDMTVKPFIKLADDSLYLSGISNFGLITEKVFNFYLFKQNLLPQSLRISRFSDLQGLWGRYIEKYLIFNLLKSMEKKGVRVIPSEDLNLPDATMIINERDVFLFEIKSSSLNKNVTIEKSVEQFKDFIDTNFVTDKKGIPQLNRMIRILCDTDGSHCNLNGQLKKLRIFPILVYAENHLNKYGVNEYAIQNAPKLDIDITEKFQKVAPVTMIHYDFFIENLRVLKGRRNILKENIEAYHHQISRLKKKYKKTNSTRDYFNTLISFDDFCAIRGSLLYSENHKTILDEMKNVFAFDKHANKLSGIN